MDLKSGREEIAIAAATARSRTFAGITHANLLSMAISPVDARKILRELVAIPSVHPEADSGGTVQGEAAMAAWMKDHLETLGAAVSSDGAVDPVAESSVEGEV